MGLNKMPTLRIGALEAGIPIVQGGMGVGVSLSELASAVANAGGIGVIATPGIGQFESDYDTNPKDANKRALGKEIRKAKATKSKLDKECYEKCVKEKGKFKCKPTNKNCPPQKQLPLVNRYNGQMPLINLPSRQSTFTEPQKNRYSNLFK